MSLLLFLFSLLFTRMECHFYKCPDIYQDACTPSNCPRKGAQKRALYKCDVWPLWSGGWGSWSEEYESYTCINSTDKYCSVWSTQEIKFRKNSTGTCFCIDNDLLETSNITDDDTDIFISKEVKFNVSSISSNYCSNWVCTELQVFTECKEDPYTETDICQDILDEEYNECQCIKSSSNDLYCDKWQCLQIKDNEIEETANYVCDDQESEYSYCISWSGDIEQEWEFELLDCECQQAHQSLNFCIKWECDEQEMTKHFSSGDKFGYFHAIFWPLFTACLLGGSCASGTKSPEATAVCVGFIVLTLGVITGGLGFMMIWLIIMAIPLLGGSISLINCLIHEYQWKRQYK